MNKEIFDRLKEIIGETMPELDISEITEDSSLKNDLGIDSIEMMMIALVIEDEYGFRFDDSISFDTVGKLCDFIYSRAE